MHSTAAQGRRVRLMALALRALLATVVVLLCLPFTAIAAPAAEPKKTSSPTQQATPPRVATATPRERTATPTTGVPGTPAVPTTPAATPTGLPTAIPTPSSTRPAQPLSGLVLVPLAVRPASVPDGLPPDKGAIRGRVLEASGRGLWGMRVKASRQGGAVTAQTGDDGAFEFSDLDPGVYSLVVEGQICTPAEGVRLAAGQALQVDFVQIRNPGATVSATRTPVGTPTPTRTATSTRTPVPPTATPTLTPTPTPRPPAASMFDPGRWWNWLGFDIDLSALASHLYLGVMGGFMVFAVGIVIALLRR